MKGKLFLSVFTGGFFGLVFYFLLNYSEFDYAFSLSFLSGLVFSVLLFVFLIIYGKIMDKRYAEFEKEITSPIFYKTNGNFNLGNGKLKNGNIYFCDAGIVCVCLEDKPYTLDEILLQDIERMQFDNIHLNIFAKDGRVFVIAIPNAYKIIDELRTKGWIK